MMSDFWTSERLALHVATQPSSLQGSNSTLLAHFLEQGFPTRRNELWKYASLSQLKLQAFELAQAQSVAYDNQGAIPRDSSMCRLVFSNGYYSAEASDPLPDGVTLSATPPSKQVLSELDPLHALNLACATTRLTLSVEPGCRVVQPIHVFYHCQGQGWMMHPHLTLDLGEDAHLTVVQSFEGTSRECFINSVTLLQLAAQAHLKLYKVQCHHATDTHIAKTKGYLSQGARLACHIFPLGAGVSRDALSVDLLGSRSHFSLHGVSLPEEKQHNEVQCHVRHAGQHTKSTQFFRSVVQEAATAAFDSQVTICDTASKSDSYQRSDAVLLGERSAAFMKPALQVDIDDVTCAHGATMGQLDPEALFYLQARGLSFTDARHLLLEGFVNECLEGLSDDLWGQSLRTAVHNKLKGI